MAVAAEAQFHVLAVDDNLFDRKLIERLLKTSSFQVTTVDSGSKALEFLGLGEEMEGAPRAPYQHEIEVSLVITDYCMPGMTGYDLLKKMKESSALRDIPVVLMSSENVPSRINRCLEEGAEEFLLKPIKLSDMNKLRPHILKGKLKELQQTDSNNNDLSPCCRTESDNIKCGRNSTNISGKKRKPMDEGIRGLSPVLRATVRPRAHG